MPSTYIRAHDLLNALVMLAPERAPDILSCARASGLKDVHGFCREIRQEIGGTLLFDAVMMLTKGGDATPQPGTSSKLFEHCVQCRDVQCSRRDCLELRGMFASMKAHSMQCVLQDRCRTCRQWQSVRDKMKLCRAARNGTKPMTGSMATMTLTPLSIRDRSFTTPSSATNDNESSPMASAGQTLLMLARTALSDLPVTTSPINSPTCSPRSKRAKQHPSTPLSSDSIQAGKRPIAPLAPLRA